MATPDPIEIYLPILKVGTSSFSTTPMQANPAGGDAYTEANGNISTTIHTGTAIPGTVVHFMMRNKFFTFHETTPICVTTGTLQDCINNPGPPYPGGITLTPEPNGFALNIPAADAGQQLEYTYALHLVYRDTTDRWVHPKIRNDNVAYKQNWFDWYRDSFVRGDQSAAIGSLLLASFALGLFLMWLFKRK